MAVAKAGGYSSNWTPSLGTSLCCGVALKRQKRQKKKKKKKENYTRMAGTAPDKPGHMVSLPPSHITPFRKCLLGSLESKVYLRILCRVPSTQQVLDKLVVNA